MESGDWGRALSFFASFAIFCEEFLLLHIDLITCLLHQERPQMTQIAADRILGRSITLICVDLRDPRTITSFTLAQNACVALCEPLRFKSRCRRSSDTHD